MEEEKSLVVENNEMTTTEDNTNIKIADDVVAQIAGVAVSEVPGVCSMTGGITDIFGKKSLSKGIKVDVSEKSTKIDVNIVVEYGVRIPDVAFQIQNRVKKAVETMTGLTVSSVNIHIQGINIQEKREEQAEQEEKNEE